MARRARPQFDNPTPGSVANLEQGGEYAAFAAEDAADSRRLRYAVVGAALLHTALFLLNFGFLRPATALAGPPPTAVFAIEPVRFKPPPPKPQEVAKRTTPLVPIPDPTPDDPEPIRIAEEIAADLDLPDTGILFDLPASPPPIEPDGPLQVGGDVTRPLKVSGPNPHYTELARRARVQGDVIVQAVIDKHGDVTDLKVLKSLPMGLDQAALEAVAKWRFEPATLNGKPVDVFYNLTVRFRLH